MTSYMELARAASEYDECDHGVPGSADCVDCMKRAHADELRTLNEEAETLTRERDEARAEVAQTRAALATPEGHSAAVSAVLTDEVERLRAEVARLRAQLPTTGPTWGEHCAGLGEPTPTEED